MCCFVDMNTCISDYMNTCISDLDKTAQPIVSLLLHNSPQNVLVGAQIFKKGLLLHHIEFQRIDHCLMSSIICQNIFTRKFFISANIFYLQNIAVGPPKHLFRVETGIGEGGKGEGGNLKACLVPRGDISVSI